MDHQEFTKAKLCALNEKRSKLKDTHKLKLFFSQTFNSWDTVECNFGMIESINSKSETISNPFINSSDAIRWEPRKSSTFAGPKYGKYYYKS